MGWFVVAGETAAGPVHFHGYVLSNRPSAVSPGCVLASSF
jgi:hypothetical protein